MFLTVLKYINKIVLLGLLPVAIVEPMGPDVNLILKYIIISTVAAGVKALVIREGKFRETLYMIIAGMLLGPLICFLIREWGYITENVREFIAAACGAFADRTVVALQSLWTKVLEKRSKKIEDEL